MMPFFTAVDSRAEVKGSRDPLGLVPVWSRLGVWVRFDPASMQLGPFLWFGGEPGEPLPDINGLRVAKHARANAQGIKQERPRQRLIPMSAFTPVDEFDELVSKLFGDFTDPTET